MGQGGGKGTAGSMGRAVRAILASMARKCDTAQRAKGMMMQGAGQAGRMRAVGVEASRACAPQHGHSMALRRSICIGHAMHRWLQLHDLGMQGSTLHWAAAPLCTGRNARCMGSDMHMCGCLCKYGCGCGCW